MSDLVKINGTMNVEKNRQILINHATPSGKCIIGNGLIFQQDNDPKHTARKVKSYSERKEVFRDVQVIKSPDLNIIKFLWDYLDQKKS